MDRQAGSPIVALHIDPYPRETGHQMSSPSPAIAAGAVVLRPSPTDPATTEVLVIHRPAYDDWSLPKGHRDPGEHLPVTAVREVFEETGIRIRLGAALPTSRYSVNGHPKEVHWWVAVPEGDATEAPDDEADEIRWVPTDEAVTLLTYQTDRRLVAQAVEVADLVPFVLVRHGKAVARVDWREEDVRRPLDERGQAQAHSLVPLLRAFGIAEVASSTAVRCADTLEPYARTAGLTVRVDDALTEELAAATPDAAWEHTRRLALRATADDVPTALCGHRPVLPLMLAALQLAERPLGTADCIVAYLDGQGKALASELFPADHVQRNAV